VGAAIRVNGICRERVFVTTKLWDDDHREPERALDTSLRELNLGHVDLYLIDFPVRNVGKVGVPGTPR